MGILIMIIGFLYILSIRNMAQCIAATISIIFGMWVHGAFDSVLGVCS